MNTNVAIIGGGAAGCFAAVCLRRMCPQADVTVYESGRRPLAKVAVTGGGRCNLTNSFAEVRSLAAVYPRGERLMKRLLREFGNDDVCRWFEAEGVRLVTQDDCCVFPKSQDAMEIVGTLTRLMRQTGVHLKTGHRLTKIEPMEAEGGTGYRLTFADETLEAVRADTVIVATGGSPKPSGLDMLRPLGVETVAPVPSLFSVCLKENDIRQLAGTVVEDVSAWIAGTKLRAQGALLITHWGMSGPAVLRLSSYGARWLNEHDYRAGLHVNWLGDTGAADAEQLIDSLAADNDRKQLASAYPRTLNARLWAHLLAHSGLNPELRWRELGRKGKQRLIETLINSSYTIDGKCRHKEEFVTCGGVDLGSLNPRTLECRTAPDVYFVGEVTDVDGVTGGFNLQAAWTMGYIAARSAAQRIDERQNKQT